MTTAHRIDIKARPQQHYAYSGRSLLVTNLEGGVNEGNEGFYVQNTRLLSRFEALVAAEPLNLVSVSPAGGDRLLGYLEVPKGEDVPAKSVYIEVATIISEVMETDFTITNYSIDEPARFELSLFLAADFADSETTEGAIRDHGMGTAGETALDAGVGTHWDEDKREILYCYLLPGLDRKAVVRVVDCAAPLRYQGGALVVSLDLAPRASATLRIAVEPIFDGERLTASGQGFAGAPQGLAALRHELTTSSTRLVSSNPAVSQAFQTATHDLATLPLGLEPGPAAPIAGLPLYQQFFGRDTMTIGWQSLLATPTLLRDSLRLNAAYQGTKVDNWLDEEPGKLVHQARWGPASLLGKDPFIRYYGDYSAPQDFVAMLGEYFAWSNDIDSVRDLLPAARKCIDWLDHYGDLDDDGFLEYVTRSEKGVKNQGWKDSGDAIVDPDGTIIENPIASSDLQCYWYSALMEAAIYFFVCGERRYAWSLQRKAGALKKRFHEAFWMEDEKFYAMALGPDKKQVKSLSSNSGHMLASGIASPEAAALVARRLLEPDFFSGWGIRTLPSGHKAYNPFSYHRGSVWPIESGTFAFGFSQYGLWPELEALAKATFDATELFAENRLPEVISGIHRDDDHPHPGIYPGSCEPQGWSASAIVLTVQALLGMKGIAPAGLLFIDPHLPEWLPELRLEGIQVGKSVLDIDFKRDRSGHTGYRVKRQEGRVRVLRQPPPGQEGVNFLDRAWAAVTSLPHS